MTLHRRSLLAGPALAALPAAAQEAFPTRPVRMVVPFPAGGATDVWARIVAGPMAERLGQAIVIDNRSGGSGMIGTEHVAKGATDGYTILFSISSFVQSPVLFRSTAYDPLADFAAIGRMGTTALVFCASPAMPVATLAEFVARARGQDLSFGSYGTGSTGHVFAQILSDHERLGMTHVGYRGEAPLLTDMLGGRVVGAFHSMTLAKEHIRAGRLKPLAFLGRDRVASLPEVPTFLELGYPEVFGWSGFFGAWAPTRVAAPIRQVLVEAYRTAMARPDVVRRLEEIDVVVGYAGPEAFQAEVARAHATWNELVTRMNIRPD
jgi:tripartite-type tricarboxylate transporter receptor subunit TctC